MVVFVVAVVVAYYMTVDKLDINPRRSNDVYCTLRSNNEWVRGKYISPTTFRHNFLTG